MDEGVAQLFVNQFNGRKIIGTVGQLQFEVIQYRLENEYNAKCRWEPISLYKACWIESDDVEELEAFKNVSISIWQKTVMDGMSSLPTVIMFSRWLKWILSILSFILLVSFKRTNEKKEKMLFFSGFSFFVKSSFLSLVSVVFLFIGLFLLLVCYSLEEMLLSLEQVTNRR